VSAECLSTRGCCGGGQRNGLSPTSGAIDESEDVSVALRRRKRTYNVNVNVGKATGRNRNGGGGGTGVNMNFCFLTRNALAGPLIDVSSHRVPKKTG
jgi:hypothetical protein